MRLLDIEERYLCSVMNGGDIQDIVLTSSNEGKHDVLKRERIDRGAFYIHAGVIQGGERIKTLGDEAPAAADLANEIRDLQKKEAIREAVKTVGGNLPSEIMLDRLREELDKISATTGRCKIISGRELQQAPYENTEFIVDKLLPVGLTVLSGAPKSGKSWLLLLLADIITGKLPMFLGFAVQKVPCLYYTLEDSANRCKYRLKKIGSYWSDKMYFLEKSRGAYQLLHDIKTTQARLVIIDTLVAYATIKDSNSYTETTARIRELKEIADSMKVAIVAVHHSRKNTGDGDWTNDIIGSQGIVGAADCIISLQRKRGDSAGKLVITGRDISDSYINIVFDDGVWRRQ
ncbi:hypothetical protein FACS1894190_14720 [Spirochaetia bacterium]|nr:hypothetical protein FACS1894190_14720 [Spirochaetia bacterium]